MKEDEFQGSQSYMETEKDVPTYHDVNVSIDEAELRAAIGNAAVFFDNILSFLKKHLENFTGNAFDVLVRYESGELAHITFQSDCLDQATRTYAHSASVTVSGLRYTTISFKYHSALINEKQCIQDPSSIEIAEVVSPLDNKTDNPIAINTQLQSGTQTGRTWANTEDAASVLEQYTDSHHILSKIGKLTDPNTKIDFLNIYYSFFIDKPHMAYLMETNADVPRFFDYKHRRVVIPNDFSVLAQDTSKPITTIAYYHKDEEFYNFFEMQELNALQKRNNPPKSLRSQMLQCIYRECFGYSSKQEDTLYLAISEFFEKQAKEVVISLRTKKIIVIEGQKYGKHEVTIYSGKSFEDFIKNLNQNKE